MIKVNKNEGKDKEQLLKEITLEDNHYKIIEIPGKLFKAKKNEIIYIEKNEVITFIKDFIANLSSSMELDIKAEVREKDNIYNVLLFSDDNAILIGREGRTLNAIQLLLHQMINNLTGFNIRVNVDASNYKENKVSRIEKTTKAICKEVIKSKIDAKLDPMNSYERRIVHSVVNTFNELKTESVGEEPQRYVVIKYKED